MKDVAGNWESAFDDWAVGQSLLRWFGHFDVAWMFRAECLSASGGGECTECALWTSPAAEGRR